MATQPDTTAADSTPEVETEVEEFSLADLAQLDVSDIAEIRFESLPAGLYTFRGTEAKFEDTTNSNDERRLVLVMKMEVVECKTCVERGVDKEDLIGKKHTEKQYIVPEKAAEGIGLIRALLADIGLPNEGPLGGVEGMEPGIVDNFVGHEFAGKIIKQGRKGDPSTKDSRLRIEPPKKPKG
jgi:hypothetical protein